MKAKRVTESYEVNEHISRIVMSLQESGADVIDPDYVANMVDSEIDSRRVAPHLTRYLSLEQLKNVVRKYLAHRFDPVEVAKQRTESNSEDLFGDLLQDHYPVKREVMGSVKAVYVARDSMTAREVEVVASTMEKTGNTLIKHADALRAYFASK